MRIVGSLLGLVVGVCIVIANPGMHPALCFALGIVCSLVGQVIGAILEDRQ